MIKKFNEPILVTKAFLPPMHEYIEQLEQIWSSCWLTNQGILHQNFIEESKKYLKVPNLVPFVNGHLALDIAVKALRLKGNVITTPFTFASTTHALIMNGVEPRFCDVNLKDFNIDANYIEELIDENTSAIMPVHVFGNPCDVQKIDEIAKKYNLKTIYDAAHVFGVEIEGTGIGNYGDVAMFSLHATKVFHSIEGGLLTFQDKELESLFNLYKNFGITGPETVEAVGLNAKMNEFQAAMGIVNLKHLDNELAKRKEIVTVYREGLSEIPGILYLEDMPGIKHNYAYFPILISEKDYGLNRNVLYERLKEFNIFTRKYFYPLTCDFQCFNDRFSNLKIPTARDIASRVLTLPLYGDIGTKVAKKITEIIFHIKKSV